MPDETNHSGSIRCSDLVRRIEERHPEDCPVNVARICLLTANHADDWSTLDDEALEAAWQDAGLRLQAATDQHAAAAEELSALASGDPDEFKQEQVWVLVRAIKVQNQILQQYLGSAAIDL